MQKQSEERAGLFHHMNDVSVYRHCRQREVTDPKNKFEAFLVSVQALEFQVFAE